MIGLIGLGAASGSILRYLLTMIIKKHLQTDFPWATFIINLSGTFILGMLLGLKVTQPMYAIFGSGLIGGYTTFSTFNTEILLLKNSSKFKVAIYYSFLSYLLGMFAGYSGFIIGKMLNS